MGCCERVWAAGLSNTVNGRRVCDACLSFYKTRRGTNAATRAHIKMRIVYCSTSVLQSRYQVLVVGWARELARSRSSS